MANINETISEVAKLNPELARVSNEGRIERSALMRPI